MSSLAEETKTVRPGEELNEQNLFAYLKDKLNLNGNLEIKQFPAGSSNLTYLVRIGAQEFVLRRPPFGNTIKTAHDMSREFRVLSALSKIYNPAPAPVLFCDDLQITGAEFYLMERKTGVVLRGLNAPQILNESNDLQKRVCDAFVDNLADLHNLDYKAAGLADLGKPDGFVRRQVAGWTTRYEKAKTHEFSELENAMLWLNQNIPAETGKAALIHNDYKFDNVMLAQNDLTKIVGVLDWEMCTIGEPLMDLGTTLGYWMDKNSPEFLLKMPFNPGVLMRAFTRGEIAARYAEKTNADVSDLLFYYVFGTFKIAVIAQQIYARFAKGLTRDRRFANFAEFVRALGLIAARAIETETV